MKNIVFISFLYFLFACSEREIETFSDGNEIYFDKFYTNELAPGTANADSTMISFFFYPTGTQEINAALVVNLSGKLPEKDLCYGVKVVEEETTARTDEYLLPEKCIFRVQKEYDPNAKEVQDTLYITLKRSERMENLLEGVRLVIELVPTEELALGQFERRRAILIYTIHGTRPEWWDSEVDINLLGKYSEKKYKCFLDNVNGAERLDGDMIKNNPDEAIKLVMSFKSWLNIQNPPVLDEDGTEMKVEI